MVAAHPLILRGFGASVFDDLNGTLRGVKPPLEKIGEGPAGTGKSMGTLGAVIGFASLYPKVPARVLIARLTRKSLTSSTCVTIRKLLPRRHPMLRGPTDAHREGYRLGAWEFTLTGTDNIDNLLSTEWDIIIGDECRQFSLKTWTEFNRGVRNYAFYRHDANGNVVAPGKGVSPIPWGMVIGCTNPWTPRHWILERARKGKLQLVHTTVEENPAYYDDEGNVTPLGEDYDARTSQFVGIQYRRLKKGEWCAASGVIFDGFESDVDKKNSNVIRIKREKDGWIARKTLQDLKISEFYAGVDFGDDSAGVLVVAGLTTDRKLIVVAEVYARRKDLDWWKKMVKKINAHYPISLGFCDHNSPDSVRAFNDVVGAPRTGPGAVFVLADKGVPRGLQLLHVRINRRTFLVDVDCLVHTPDQSLVDANMPTCALDEVHEYTFRRDDDDDDLVSSQKPYDEPDPKCIDHGMDAWRYLVVGVDYIVPSGVLPDPVDVFGRNRFRALMRSGQPGTPQPGSNRKRRGEYVEPDPEDEQDWDDEDPLVAADLIGELSYAENEEDDDE